MAVTLDNNEGTHAINVDGVPALNEVLDKLQDISTTAGGGLTADLHSVFRERFTTQSGTPPVTTVHDNYTVIYVVRSSAF